MHIDIPSSILGLDQFTIYRRDRKTHAGGILIAVRNDLRSKQNFISSNNEILVVEITTKSESYVIVLIYIPHCQVLIAKNALDELHNHLKPVKNYLIAGDFNLPISNWNDVLTGNSEIMLLFKNCYLSNQPLYQIINEPSRGKNILDLGFTYNINRVSDVHVRDSFSISDHCAIHLNLNFNFVCTNIEFYYDLLVHLVNYNNIQNEFVQLNIQNLILNYPSAKDKWMIFNQFINNTCKSNVPLKFTKYKKRTRLISW